MCKKVVEIDSSNCLEYKNLNTCEKCKTGYYLSNEPPSENSELTN